MTLWGYQVESDTTIRAAQEETVLDPWGAGPPRTIPIRRGTFMSGRRRGSKRVAVSTRVETVRCR